MILVPLVGQGTVVKFVSAFHFYHPWEEVLVFVTVNMYFFKYVMKRES